MIRILKYLKPFILSIIAIVALLAIQATSDLSLPEYTARIVNVGIQQGGVENASPDVIRQTEMDKILLFMSSDAGNDVLSHYTLLEPQKLTSQELEDYAAEYPAIRDEALYVRNDVDQATLDELNGSMDQAILTVYQLESDPDMASAIVSQMAAAFPPGTLPENAGIFDILTLMPMEQRQAMLDKMSEQFAGMPDTMLQQAAMTYVKAEYDAVGIDTGSIQTHYILIAGLKMLGMALLGVVASITVALLSARVAAGMGMNLRGNVFKKVLNFSNAELDHFSSASLITRSTNDIQQIQMLMMMLFRIVFYAPIIGIGGYFKAMQASNSMAWVIGIALLSMLLLVGGLFTIAMPKFKMLQTLIDRLNLVSREILTGLPVIRAFGNDRHEEKRFDAANLDLTRTSLFVNRAMAIMMPTMMLIMNGIAVLIVWAGASKIDTGAMQVGDLMAFIQYTMQIVMAFLMISMISIMLPRASVSAKRIMEVLDTKETISDPRDPRKLSANTAGYLEFRDVSFRYPHAEEDVLSHISFTAKPGENTAIIGSTGSGKSTLINLIPRFYDVTDGELLIDGVNVKDVTQHDLRGLLGFVPQKGMLFSGTIESNIKYADLDISDEQMCKAAEVAQAIDFIEEKPDKFASEISQEGTNVSGGQKQRLSIARAVAKNPRIYIFDDSFSALDYRTDRALRDALKKYTGGSTVIIVAQRINTILHADQIVVLDEGKVVGKGTHTELMRNCDVYRQIALSQLSEEELAK